MVIVHNDAQDSIAHALAAAAAPLAGSVTLVPFPSMSRHGEEPPSEVAEAFAAADVVLAPTSMSLSSTEARRQATARGARVATMPTITEEIFHRALAVDYPQLRRRSEAVAELLTSAATAHVTSPAGTDIVLALEGRTGRSDDGHLREPGAFGNLPAGEGYIAPLETVGDGTIVYDGSLAGHGRLGAPVRVTVRDGRAVAAETEVGRWLLDTLDAGGAHGRSLAELGIGTNPAATLSGNVLEDEKAIGTAHLAFGTSAGLGGVNVASVHIDGIILYPTVELDGTRVLDEGVFVVT